MQANDIDPNYGGFLSGSFQLWPWTRPKERPPFVSPESRRPGARNCVREKQRPEGMRP